MVDYLERYAARSQLAPRFDHAVTSARREGAGWVVRAGDAVIEARADRRHRECGADTTLAVRSPVHVVPRDLFGVPAQINSLYGFGRLPAAIANRLVLAILDRAVGDLSPFGLRRPEIGPVRQRAPGAGEGSDRLPGRTLRAAQPRFLPDAYGARSSRFALVAISTSMS